MLVRSMPSESVYAVPHDIVDADLAADKLKGIFGKIDTQTRASLHDKRLWFVWIQRKVSHDVAERVRALDAPVSSNHRRIRFQ